MRLLLAALPRMIALVVMFTGVLIGTGSEALALAALAAVFIVMPEQRV